MIDNLTDYSSLLDYFDVVFAAIGALCGWFFGSWDGLMKMLIALCVIDYCTGFISAYIQKRLSSAVGFRGIARKITMFALVGIAHVIDREMLGQTALLRDAVIFFYLANEGLSVLENAVAIGIPIPEALKHKLLQIKDSHDNHDNHDTYDNHDTHDNHDEAKNENIKHENNE